jgi:hypothetical protein
MRYRAYFAAKLMAAAAVLFGLLRSLKWVLPPAPLIWIHGAHQIKFTYIPPRFGYDLWFTLALLVWFLLCTGTLYFIIWDQRYRCRVCLRRLRMPVETGSWSRMLQFGRPRIEYICPYGHGTLKEDEFQISGLANPEWTPHSDDLWEELCASSKDPGDQP